MLSAATDKDLLVDIIQQADISQTETHVVTIQKPEKVILKRNHHLADLDAEVMVAYRPGLRNGIEGQVASMIIELDLSDRSSPTTLPISNKFLGETIPIPATQEEQAGSNMVRARARPNMLTRRCKLDPSKPKSHIRMLRKTKPSNSRKALLGD